MLSFQHVLSARFPDLSLPNYIFLQVYLLLCYTKNMKKVLFALVLFILAFAVPVTVYTIVSDSADFDIRERAAEEDPDNLYAPRIVSIPSTEVSIGDKYTYKVRAVDSDGNTLEHVVTDRPDWLVWNDGLKVLEGIPTSADAGVFDVKITVSDGKWIDTQVYKIYILEEGELKWDEDFEVGSGDDGDGSDSAGPGESESSSSSSGTSSTSDSERNQDMDPEEYGLTPVVADAGDQGGADVLGATDTQLPNTALFSGLLGGSAGFAAICVAIFLWADARWNIVNGMSLNRKYANGEQIAFKVAGGRIVKKREIKL